MTYTEEIRKAEQRAAMWLHWGNLASERGDTAKAERHYERAQRWHDRMNEAIERANAANRQTLIGV